MYLKSALKIIEPGDYEKTYQDMLRDVELKNLTINNQEQ